MKKMVWIMVIALALAFIACGDDDDPITYPPPAHVHDYEWTVSIPATCIATGVEEGVCKLDPSHITTREIAIDTVNGHDWDFDNATETVAPTCTKKGSGTANCKRNGCNETNTDTDIPALGHDWDYDNATVTTPSTCTKKGSGTISCKRVGCNETNTDTNNIPKLAHTIAAGAYLCSVCNNPGELGDTGPGGGKIFYVSTEGFTMTDDNSTAHYLEAAPADMPTTLAWASSAFMPSQWMGINIGGTGDWTDITGTATGIGTGRKNTALILATDADAPAAKACDDYSTDDKTDWFLPSKDELNQLYVNRTSVGNLKKTADWVNSTELYWSSSQFDVYADVDAGGAWGQHFVVNDGFQSGYVKYSTVSVRAIRAF